jgi:hypothetical protein
MPKKEKKGKKDKKSKEKPKPIKDDNFAKMEALSHIEELSFAAQDYRNKGNFDGAIVCADRIIRMAIQYELAASYIKEQEDFINSMAKKIQKAHITSQIKEYTLWIDKQYDKLVEENAIVQAHDLVESLKERYKDVPEFDTIDIVQELIIKDKRAWIKYHTQH